MTDESVFDQAHEIVHCKQNTFAPRRCLGCSAVRKFGRFGDFICVRRKPEGELAEA